MCDVRVLSVCPSEEDSRVPLFSVSVNGQRCKTPLTKEEAGNYIRGEMLKTLIKKHEELEKSFKTIKKHFITNNNQALTFGEGVDIFDSSAIETYLVDNFSNPTQKM